MTAADPRAGGPDGAPPAGPVDYAALEGAATDPSGGDWRTRMMGRSVGPAAEQAIQRSQAVITATARVIQRSGSADFTMRQVAEEAQLSLRAVYKLFAGKDELLVALVEEVQMVLVHLLERRVAAYDDPLERLGGALYFTTDPRQHTDHEYNAAVVRYVTQVSITAPDLLFRARQPVIAVLTRLIDDAMAAGQLDQGDPERAACSIFLTYGAYQSAGYLGNSTGAALPTHDGLVTYCLRGLGATISADWVARLRVSDDEAARHRHESEHAAGTLPRTGDPGTGTGERAAPATEATAPGPSDPPR